MSMDNLVAAIADVVWKKIGLPFWAYVVYPLLYAYVTHSGWTWKELDEAVIKAIREEHEKETMK